ncbi:hypothetical protein O6H91_02G104200 [Diphasiastrum complanatum]|uniref:Uncharacterized protein n=2 Tax=Diphasiastrum complanatum TaxID=34168 RepID=A0ACC2EIY8_DIPCM|nr:hypothetical protein O6H91_02G104200 [Diphasiastrum complanatum]KAJ7566460.1 hypothetical protein O6H91_02G104200 [Diphasiastrum complanatum]
MFGRFAGNAFQSGRYLWLNGRQALTSAVLQQKEFFKDANINTVLCIPFQDGVLELGTVNQVHEEYNLVYSICHFLSQKIVTIAEDVCSWPIELLQKTSVSSVAQTYPVQIMITNIPKIGEEPEGPDNLTLTNQDSQESNVVRVWQSQGTLLESLQESNTSLENSIMNIDSLDDASKSLNPDISDNVAEWLFISSHENSPRLDHNLQAGFQNSQMPNQNLTHLNKVNTSAFKNWHPDSTFSSAQRTQADQWMLKSLHEVLRQIHAVQLEKIKANPLQISLSSHGGSRSIKGSIVNPEDGALNHRIAEKERRRQHSQQFSILRSLIPFASKGDRVSILKNTITYLKQLEGTVEDLEKQKRELQSIIENNRERQTDPARDVNEEDIPSPSLSVEEVFFALRKQSASPRLTTVGTGESTIDTIKAEYIQHRSLHIEICCPKKTSDILIKILLSLVNMGLEVSSSVQTSTSDNLYVAMTTYDTVGARDHQRLSAEVEKVLKELLSMD